MNDLLTSAHGLAGGFIFGSQRADSQETGRFLPYPLEYPPQRSRVRLHGEPEWEGVGLSLQEHISPTGWENVLLYKEYVLNRSQVRP